MAEEKDNKRAKPTTADKAAARRLLDIWGRVKTERDIGQRYILDHWTDGEASSDTISQGAVSQYLRGRIPLGLTAVIRFARILGCAPDEIRSDLPGISALRAGGENVETVAAHIAPIPHDAWPFSFPFRRFERMPPEWRQKCEGAALAIVQEYEAEKKRRSVPKPKQRNSQKKVSRA
jgi:hypothetical protein